MVFSIADKGFQLAPAVLITGAGVVVGVVIIGTSETSELVEQARTLISTILTKRTFSLYKLYLNIILIFY